jgi:hypothetical protein
MGDRVEGWQGGVKTLSYGWPNIFLDIFSITKRRLAFLSNLL